MDEETLKIIRERDQQDRGSYGGVNGLKLVGAVDPKDTDFKRRTIEHAIRDLSPEKQAQMRMLTGLDGPWIVTIEHSDGEVEYVSSSGRDRKK